MKNGTKRLFTALRARNWTRLVGPTVGACVLAVLLTTSAGADTTPTTYYACVNMQSGLIYMVNAGDTCKHGYTPISWNQVGPQGPQGPQGPAGPQGPQGPQGPAGPTQTLVVQQVFADVVIPEGQARTAIAQCPAGTFVTGGGFDAPRSGSAVATVLESKPDVAENAWIVLASAPVVNTGNSLLILNVYALCTSLA